MWGINWNREGSPPDSDWSGIGQRSDSELQANNPVKYTDPDGRTTHKKSLTRSILNILIGKENVDRIWAEPFYDGFAEFSDKILFAAIEAPCEIVGQASDYAGIFALATGNVPLAAAAETVSKATDVVSFGTAVLKAYTTDDWSDVYKQAASKGVSYHLG